MDAPNATTLVIHYDEAGGQRAAAARAVLGAARAHLGHADRQQRQGSEVLPARGAPADRRRRRRTPSPSTTTKGTTVFKPNPYFYGPKSQRRGGGDDLLHERHHDDRRPSARATSTSSTRCRSTRSARSRATGASTSYNRMPSLGGHQHHLQLQPGQAQEPRAARPQGERGARVRHRPQADRGRRLRRATPSRGRTSSRASRRCWLNPAIKPLPFDVDKANQILDSLGYKKGSDGIREVPATTGKYAQPAHEMSYDLMVPGDARLQRRPPVPDHRQRLAEGRCEAPRGGRAATAGQAYGLRDRRQLHQVRPGHVGLGRVHRP